MKRSIPEMLLNVCILHVALCIISFKIPSQHNRTQHNATELQSPDNCIAILLFANLMEFFQKTRIIAKEIPNHKP